MRRRLVVVLCCWLLLVTCAAAQSNPPQYTISTYAGLGPNNMPATVANLSPRAVVADTAGNYYVASTCHVYKVSLSGDLVQVAGAKACQATAPLIADGIPAHTAPLGTVLALALDSSGNLYLADSFLLIYKITASGAIYRIGGDGTTLAAPAGVNARFSGMQPTSLAVDAFGVVCFTDGHTVRMIDTAGILYTIAGSPTPGFYGDGGSGQYALLNTPSGLVFDASGNLYISDSGNSRVRMIASSGTITTVAGTGSPTYNGDVIPATYANLQPVGIALDNAGNLLIADSFNARIRRMFGGYLDTVAGNGSFAISGDGAGAFSAGIGQASVVASIPGSGDFFLADSNTFRLRKVSAGVINTVAGNGTQYYSGDGVAAIDAAFAPGMRSLSRDTAGNFYIADWGNQRIRKIDTNGNVTLVAGNGVVAPPTTGQLAVNSSFETANFATADSMGNVYFTEANQGSIYKVDTAGMMTLFAYPLIGPTALGVDVFDNIYAAADNRMYRYDLAGSRIQLAGYAACEYNGDEIQSTLAGLCSPMGLDFDSAGNIYFADRYNSRIRKIDTAGMIHTVAGNGVNGDTGDGGPATSAQIYYPTALARDAAGNLYFTEFDMHKIRMVDTNGVIWTIAGTGAPGYSGDGGAATAAMIDRPYGIAVDNAGNVYFDEYFGRIRKLTPSAGAPVTTATTTPIPNSNGWFKSQVTVLFSATGTHTIDKIVWSLSGPQSSSGEFPGASGSLTVDTEGVNSITYYAVDATANAESPHSLLVKIDKTPPNPPTISAYPQPYSDGWNATPVYVMFYPAGDPGADASGVDTCTQPQMFETETAGTEAIGTCSDKAGNVSAPVSTTIRISFQPADMALVFQPDERLSDGTHIHHIRLMNNGPGNAHNVYFLDEIVRDPVLGVTTSAGSCQNSTVFIMCSVDAIAAGTGVDVGIHVTAPKTGWTAHSMKIYALETDPVPTNNSAQMQDGTNHAPVAAAGPDRFVPGASAAGAQVRLDGSASADPDADPLSFRWTGAFPEGGGVVTGATPVVTLPFGASAVTLTVNDGRLDSTPVKLTVTVTRFRVDVAGGPSGTIASGDAAAFQVAITPELGSFDAAVALACVNPPAGVTCSFSPATVTPRAAAAVTTLTVQTPRTAAHRRSPALPWGSVFAGAFGVMLLGGRRIPRWLLAALCVAAILALVSCGAMQSASAPATPVRQPVTMTITVTGTSSGLQQTGTTSFVVR